ncbi:MAG TPA: TonB-dependent receptor [Candidatus Baltobacteraceae bacterium]|nr:TonB-dependent receptor [Candidatus Baltobacteraceae bacterium]
MYVLAVIVAVATASPTPSPAPGALPVIGTVRVVTGSPEAMHKLPMPASLLDTQAIANSPALTSDGLLGALPGFDRDRSNSMFTNYGQLRVSFSGMGNDRGLVLADGVPAQDGFGGQIDWAEYPAPDITRAELLRGVGSALYGGGAIGGVLALQTFAPTAQTSGPAAGYLRFSGGTHAFAQTYAQATAPLSGKLSASVAAFSQRLQYDDLAPGYQTAHDNEAQTQENMASIRLRYAADPQTILEYGYRGAWDYQYEGRSNYDFWRNLVQNAVRIAHSTKQGTLTAGYYERNAFVVNQADEYPSKPGTLLYTQYVPTHESGISADWIVEGDRSTFEVHSDAKFVGGVSNQYNGAGIFSVAGSGTQDLQGLALQETLHGKRFEIIGGLRGDAIDLFNASTQKGTVVTPIVPRVYRALSPRLAARYDLTKRLAFRASVGGGYRAPYLNELVRGYQIGAVQYLPNSALVPERSSSLSSGFDWSAGANELSLDFNHSYVNDAIDFCTISATVQMRCNFSHTRTDGTTLAYVRAVGACSRVMISGNQQYARITVGTPGEVGKQLPYVPKGSASVAFDSQVGAVQTGVDVDYLGMTWADDLNQEPLGTAVTAGLHAVFPLEAGARLTLSADNVTNAHYLSSIDRYGPPQVISLALSAPVGGARAFGCAGTREEPPPRNSGGV